MATAAAPRAAAATAAAVAPPRRPPSRQVAVIGAGFAGLSAALALQRSGCCSVVVLEAAARPGGRAHTQRLPSGQVLELGATWFHGLGTPEEPNPVFQAAVEQGLIGSSPTAEKWWSSAFLLPGASQPLSKEQQIAVTHTLAAWGDTVEELPAGAQGSTAQHLQDAWSQLLACGRVAPEQRELAQRAWRWREHLQRAMDGCDSTADQGAAGLAAYDEMPGGVHCALPAGMQTVAEGMAAQVADLRFQHAVQRIEWGSPSGSSDSTTSSRVHITCSNGEVVEADAAVVTVSLGVLKAQHEQLFSPPLPAAKAAAIERLRIGCVDKLFLDFAPAPAGSSSRRGSSTMSTSSESGPPMSYALLWSAAWDSSDAGAAAALAPAPAEAQLPGWAKGIFSLRFGGPEVKQPGSAAAGQRSDQPQAASEREPAAAAEGSAGEDEEYAPCAEPRQPTCYQAVAWLTGEAARAMEAASDEEVLAALRRLPAVFPQLQLPPGASWDNVRLYRSHWGSDPLVRGSYSYLSPDCTPADVAALAEPLWSPARAAGDAPGSSSPGGAPALLFAGEACHLKYIGTMHGAALTGQAAAERLIHQWQQPQAASA